MAVSKFERSYSPLIILGLLAALVVVVALWALDRAATTAGSGTQRQAGVPGEVIAWKLVTTWPKNFPGLGLGPENFARIVKEMSNGRLSIHVYGAGEVVPAFGVFDAVSRGVAEMGHGAAYYWTGKIPAAVFFSAIPFGFTAQEINAWLHYGGGLELWREIYAPFNLIPLAGGNSGVQMGGWFNKEINSVEDLKGLKMRMPGLGGEVLTRAGGTAVTLPGSELYTSLQTGVIDATEWVGPYNDRALGLHQVARYYYYPGWHEPGSTLEFIVNRDAYESLPADLQAIVTHAARAINQDMLDEFTARNNAALQDLIDNHGVQLRKFPDDVIVRLHQSTEEALRDLAASDPLAKRVYASYKDFLEKVTRYHHISEQAYINARDLK
ncbi:MAG: TRAP transporter substrate-binding protein [Gammaproteobacteria bacterium]|nr:TRAP transporter substrate-binding protein [Gammaproteobacteria bacterium]